MADPNLAVPKPESSDVDDVVLGLETAATLWKRGDAQDAIRWVRRAAEAAEEAGNDMRALTLARAAADLTTAQERAPKPAPATPKPVAAAPKPAATVPKPAVASQPSSPKPAPTPSSPPVAPKPSTPPPTPSPPPPASTPFAASPQGDSGPASARRPPTPPGAATPGAKQTKARGGGALDALSELASLARADGAAAAKSRPTSPTALRGLRVALTRSKDQPGVLLARVLADDEIAERGEKNGMVIATEVIVEQLLKPR